MKLAIALFARLGFPPRKVEAPDLFAVRLDRIGLRERRCTARSGVFKTLSSRQAV